MGRPFADPQVRTPIMMVSLGKQQYLKE